MKPCRAASARLRCRSVRNEPGTTESKRADGKFDSALRWKTWPATAFRWLADVSIISKDGRSPPWSTSGENISSMCLCGLTRQDRLSTQTIEPQQGYNMMRWSRGGFQFWAVSDVGTATSRNLSASWKPGRRPNPNRSGECATCGSAIAHLETEHLPGRTFLGRQNISCSIQNPTRVTTTGFPTLRVHSDWL